MAGEMDAGYWRERLEVFSPWLRQGVGDHFGWRRPSWRYPLAEPGAEYPRRRGKVLLTPLEDEAFSLSQKLSGVAFPQRNAC
jgi:hypothetical protein